MRDAKPHPTRRRPGIPRALQRFLAPLVFCILAGLTGCPRNPEPDNDTPTPSETYRILLVTDPFSSAIERMQSRIERELQIQLDIETVIYDDVRVMALQNHRDKHSQYDLIAFDIVWLGEYVGNGVLLPVPPSLNLPYEDILQPALETNRMHDKLYGVPIQPHAELLWVRQDLLDRHQLAFPQTTEDLLATARALHRPEENLYGIAWNAQRGQPLGQSMAHFFAAFGQPLLDENGRPAFDTDRGLAAARYVMSLMEVSPPDILTMAWDQRTSRFASGHVAMTYGWGARSFIVEQNPSSRVRGHVTYGPAPHSPQSEPVTPLGVWSLGIPANVQDPQKSFRLLEWLYQEEEQRQLAFHGNGAPALSSLFTVPELRARYPVLTAMSREDIRKQLRADMRPSVPEWDRLCEILGTEFHDMLLGESTPEEALRRASERSQSLFAPDLSR